MPGLSRRAHFTKLLFAHRPGVLSAVPEGGGLCFGARPWLLLVFAAPLLGATARREARCPATGQTGKESSHKTKTNPNSPGGAFCIEKQLFS